MYWTRFALQTMHSNGISSPTSLFCYLLCSQQLCKTWTCVTQLSVLELQLGISQRIGCFLRSPYAQQSHPICTGRAFANTTPHQLRWCDQEIGTGNLVDKMHTSNIFVQKMSIKFFLMEGNQCTHLLVSVSDTKVWKMSLF